MSIIKYEPAVRHILKLFAAVFFLVPPCFALMLLCTLGFEKIKAIVRMVLIFAPPLILIVSVRFMFLNKKLDRYLKEIKNNNISGRGKIEKFVNSYPLRAAATIVIIISAGPLIVGLAGFNSGVLFSWQETCFFIFLGQSLAFLSATIIYYQAKIKLYDTIFKIEYRPLSLFEKISMPILSILIMILIFTSCFLYRISVQRNLSLSDKNIGIASQLAGARLELHLQKAIAGLKKGSVDKEFNSRDFNSLQRAMSRLHLGSIMKFIPENGIAEKARIMIVSEAGKVLYDSDRRHHEQIVGKTIIDDGSSFQNTKKLFSSDDKTVFPCTFSGEDMIAVSEKLDVAESRLVLLLDKAEYYSEVNAIMLQIIVIIMLLNVIMGAILFRIIRNISNPIRHVINIFEEVAAGNITVRSNEFLPDASGNLIISLNKLLEKLNEVAHISVDSSKQLAASSEGLATSSQDLASGAQTQAESVEEASAALEELASSIDNIAQHAESQSELAKDTYRSMEDLKNIIHTVAGHAQEALTNATGSTHEAVRGSELMQNTIEGMNNIDRSTERIAEIVVIIHDISDKVQLLALNAAIEAARAGEHGRGFAVVADEIAKLADKTTTSANQIADFIDEGRGEVNRGKKFVDETSRTFTAIIENIRNTDKHVRLIAELAREQDAASESVLNHTKQVMEMSEKISTATKEQGQTNREMLGTIETITHLTQSVAANAEEIASSSEEIGAQAVSLHKEIEFFKV